MNTLPKAVTSTFFEVPDGFNRLDERFKRVASAGIRLAKLGPEHMLLAQAARGRNWKHGFASMTNSTKLENGGIYSWGPYRALLALKGASKMALALDAKNMYLNDEAKLAARIVVSHILGPFGGTISREGLVKIVDMLPDPSEVLIEQMNVRSYNEHTAARIVQEAQKKEVVDVSVKVLSKVWS